jgi:predicted outer membrane repeat protein
MMRLFIFAIAFILITSGFCWSTIINIPADYPTIQQGIDASTDGDTVLVQPGTYVENINFNGHNIVLASLFLTTADTIYISQTIIDGDSAGTAITLDSGEGANSVISGFTIRRGYAQNGGGIICANSSSPAIRENRIIYNYADKYGAGIYCVDNSDPEISGNSIEHNLAISDSISHGGGGICMFNSSPLTFNNNLNYNAGGSGGAILCYAASPEISNNQIIENDSHSHIYFNGGGGILCWDNSGALISGNVFSNNSADDIVGNGGGILVADSPNIKIIDNQFYNNSANGGGAIACVTGSDNLILGNTYYGNSAFGGGAILIDVSDPIIANNKFIQNTAYEGGGLYGYNSSPNFYANIFDRNSATFDHGGAIFCSSNWDPMIIGNCVFYGNTSVGTGSVVYSLNYVAPIIYNSIFIDNGPSLIFYQDTIDIIYSNIEGGWPGEGNIDIDPLFRDAANGDFHLMSISCGDPFDSPCIDAGDPAISDDSLDCFYGLGTATSDMGAYGGGCHYAGGDVNNSGFVNGLDVIYLVNYLKGGTAPPKSCACSILGQLYVAADANGSCSVNGLDVTYMVSYFKGGPGILFCEDCPPSLWQ